MLHASDQRALDRSQPFRLGNESRFPLDLTPSEPAIWSCYEESLAQRWDPEEPSFWAHDDVSSIDPDDRRAAALVWSHRAWVEYVGIAESEALLVRLCLEQSMPVDTKYCLSIRAVERARAADACHLLAERFGGYVTDPGPTIAAALNAGLVRRALHTDVAVDAYFVAHIGVRGLIDRYLWEGTTAAALDPTAHALMTRILSDKRRQVQWSWEHIVARSDVFDVEAVSLYTSAVIDHDDHNGFLVPSSLPPCPERTQLLDAQTTAAAAGLGALPPAQGQQLMEHALDDARQRLGAFGVSLR